MRHSTFFAILLVALLAIAGSATAQQAVGAGETPTATTQPTVSPDPAATGLPQVAPPPRTLRAHWHVFIAFAFAWGLLFAYALVLGRRFAGLESQIRRLEGRGP